MALLLRCLLISVVILLTSATHSKAQTPKKIVQEFVKGNLDYVAKRMIVPFEDHVIDTVLTNNDLESKKQWLGKVLKVIPPAELKAGEFYAGPTQDGVAEVIVTLRAYESDGELASESSLVFYFKKIKSKYWLYRMFLAG